MAEEKIPLGKGKGSVLVTEADDEQIAQFLRWFEKEKRPAKWLKIAEACEKERDARTVPPEEEKASEAIERVPPAIPLSHDPFAINERFKKLAENYHIVSVATHVDALPLGFGVSVSFVNVNPDSGKDGPGDVYSTGKKVGLSGHVIQQIGAALAVDWDARESGRLDDGSDPRYVHFRATGWVKNFDGTPRRIVGEVEMDLRDGSPQVEEIKAKAEARARKYKDTNDGGAAQIMEMRKFILRHAETKAQLRAISKGVGLKRAYHPAELKKPFAVARLSFTGHTEDPELKKEFARMLGAAALSGMRALYGEPPPAALPPAPIGHAPPPLGAVDGDLEDDEPDFEPDDMPDNGEGGGIGEGINGQPPGEDD